MTTRYEVEVRIIKLEYDDNNVVTCDEEIRAWDCSTLFTSEAEAEHVANKAALAMEDKA